MKIPRIHMAIVFLVLAGQLGSANAQTLTTLYNFTGGTNGSLPSLARGQVSTSTFYGSTEFGGTSANCTKGCGTIFKLTSAGTLTMLYSFSGTDGNNPDLALQATDGDFYGATGQGGTDMSCSYGVGCGTIFKITSAGTLTTLYDFSGADGSLPALSFEGSDSVFYGETIQGGAYTNSLYYPFGCGTIFSITSGGALTTLHNFDGTDGSAPVLTIQASDGDFYGSTVEGGTDNSAYYPIGYGTVFKITSAGTLTTLYNFSGADGSGPSLTIQASDGDFYGATGYGGPSANCTNGCGTIFKITSAGTLTTLYNFSGTDGSVPSLSFQASDGDFYGMTLFGGTSANCPDGCGTIFKITSAGTLTTLHDFSGADGSSPVFAFQGSDGDIYGTTKEGGTSANCTYGCGTVFKFAVGGGSGGGGGGTNCTFSIGSTNAVFDAAGGPGSVSVTASNGCAWTATSTNAFITITSGGTGTGNGTVHYSVAANTSTNGLTGTMTIAGQTFTVTQAGESAETCTYTLSATSVTLPAKGGSKNVSVKVKGTDCSWTATNNAAFITITSGSSGTGNGKVDYTVPGNTNTTALSGTMTIAGKTFTVNQAAGGCTFKLSPKNGKFKAAGGSATVKVKPNLSDCAWTATNTNSFITITSGASGVGNGTVSYTVAPNTNTTALTGLITIAGETFTITQAGAK
jgi:uncharacterized repeat protein (TIGR03803 family)